MFNIEKIADYAPFCFSCLGRTVGRVGFGLDNRERGLEMLSHFESDVPRHVRRYSFEVPGHLHE